MRIIMNLCKREIWIRESDPNPFFPGFTVEKFTGFGSDRSQTGSKNPWKLAQLLLV